MRWRASVRGLALAAALGAPAAAQIVVDGSDAKLSPSDRKILLNSVAMISVDPGRVEMRRVVVGPDGVFCGEASLLGPGGARKPYAPFYIDPRNRSGNVVDPLDPSTAPYLRADVAGRCGR